MKKKKKLNEIEIALITSIVNLIIALIGLLEKLL